MVVASNGGDDRAPGWLHNVRAEPVVEVQVGAGRRHATARVVERGEPDYDRLWALVNANNHGRYDGYQARTTRPHPARGPHAGLRQAGRDRATAGAAPVAAPQERDGGQPWIVGTGRAVA